MRATPSRFAPLLLLLCLTGCGQTGDLFMRMPDVDYPTLAPPLTTNNMPIIWLPPGTTLPAPVSATAPAPTAGTHPAPAAATHP